MFIGVSRKLKRGIVILYSEILIGAYCYAPLPFYGNVKFGARQRTCAQNESRRFVLLFCGVMTVTG
jgi:hypothetical protein